MKSFDSLWLELKQIATSRPSDSGTVAALDCGTALIAKKVLEEAGEVFAAANHESDEQLALELSQLLYWSQVLLLSRGMTIDDVYRRL